MDRSNINIDAATGVEPRRLVPDYTPLTVGELYEHLRAMLARNANMSAAIVTYGQTHERVAGGHVLHRSGLTVVNLAPMKLDQKGGF